MKATGIIRKIDDLGRIVIPKEIRKRMKIREGDTLEIYVEKTGEVILKKYEPLYEMKSTIETYAETLASTTNLLVLITDNKKIIAASGTGRREYLGADITEEIAAIISRRNTWSTKENQIVKVISENTKDKIYSEAIVPIISDSDLLGAVIIISTDSKRLIGEWEIKLAQVASTLLGKQME
ncbi:MAG: AbrB/MazE/SpoVT family DNA-binding domain-containing protein [Clostridia bacterium]|nr:AbrB/MazE/SpoVT family DNA-binding domain-containing protein [Clostridia bacterium]